MAGHFGMGGSLRPGWDWCRDSTPAETSNECSGSPNAAIRISHASDSRRTLGAVPAWAKTDSRNRWIAEKKKILGTTKACVAVANKNARIIWALLARDEPYRAAA